MAKEDEAEQAGSRKRALDDDAEEPEAKVSKLDENAEVVVPVGEEKEQAPKSPAKKDADDDDKPSSALFGCASTTGGFGGFGGFGGSAKPGEGFGAGSGKSGVGGGGFGGFGVGGGVGFGGFGGIANTACTESGFPSLSKVFGDTNKPVQLFGKGSSAVAAGAADEDGDDEAPESAPAETKPLIALQEEAAATGEEDEECIFTTEGALYEFLTEEGKAPSWKERGRGEMRLNLSKTGGARMIMRAKGNFRLILNAAMWKGQTFTKMEGGKGLSFPCKNAVAGPVS
jgi:Ran-binding protein 3